MSEKIGGDGVVSMADVGRFRRAMLVSVLVSSGPLMGLIIVSIAPILPMLASRYGGGAGGAWLAQLLLTVPSAGIMLGGPATGWLVERFGPRRVAIAGLASYVVAGAIGVFTVNPFVLLPSRLLVGLGAVAVATASMAVLAVHFDEDERNRILGYQGAAGSAFGIAGILVAGEIAQAFGIQANFSLYLSAIAVLAMALAAMPEGSGRTSRSAVGSTPSLMNLWPLYLIYTLVFCASFMPSVQLGFLLIHDGVSSSAVISRVLAGNAIGAAAGSWSFSALGTRLGHDRISVFALIAWAIGFIASGGAHDVTWIATGAVITGFGFGLLMPYAAAVLLRKAPPEARGRAMGLFYTAIYLGDFICPFVAMPIRGAIGVHGLFLVTGMAISMAACIRLAAYLRKPLA